MLPAVPDRDTGGGVLLYETLAFLRGCGELHAVVPVGNHLRDAYEAIAAQPDLHGIRWHALRERAGHGFVPRMRRLLSPNPAEVFKFATPENREVLANARRECSPTTEVMIATRAAASYPRVTPHQGARLYMMDIDPKIMPLDGPSFIRRVVNRMEYRKVDRLCGHVLRTAARVGSISAKDVAELNRMGGRSDVRHVPPVMRPRPGTRHDVELGHVLITTNFSYPPNRDALEWFLRDCWPHVDRVARLTITGIDGDGRLQRLCGEHPRVAYAGCLPRNELDALFERAALAVNPTRSGSGFQIKLLDALARGTPVVSTEFSNRVGPMIPSSDDPRHLAELINERLVPNSGPPFDYAAFHRDAIMAWEAFLFGG